MTAPEDTSKNRRWRENAAKVEGCCWEPFAEICQDRIYYRHLSKRAFWVITSDVLQKFRKHAMKGIGNAASSLCRINGLS